MAAFFLPAAMGYFFEGKAFLRTGGISNSAGRKKKKPPSCEKNVDLHDFFGYNEQA